MILHTSQLPAIEEVEEILKRYRVKPLVVKGSLVNFVWPPQPAGVPLDLLRRFPRDVYVVFKGKTLIIVP